jgi:hypothetical protein
MSELKFGGWSIEKFTYNWILNNIKKGSTILELGSGYSTIELSKKYNVISIEHDEEFIGLSKNSKYIKTDIFYEFYDIKSIKNELPKNYDLLLIDGPPKSVSDRYNFIKNIEYFNLNTNILIDDTNRENDLKLLKKLSKILNKPYTVIKSNDKSFGIILK